MNKAVKAYILKLARQGGKARAIKLTAKRRSEIAKHAAVSRWTRTKDLK